MGICRDVRGADFAAMRYVAAVAVSMALAGVAVQGWGRFQADVDSAACLGEMERLLDESRCLWVHAPPACIDGCGSTVLDVSLPRGCRCTLGARPGQAEGEVWPAIGYALLPNGTLVTLFTGVPICGDANGGCAPVLLTAGTNRIRLDVRGPRPAVVIGVLE